MFGEFDITFCMNASMCPRNFECGRNLDLYDKEKAPPMISMALFVEDRPSDCRYFFTKEKFDGIWNSTESCERN